MSEEAERIYSSIFHSPIPDILRQRFLTAVTVLEAGFSDEDIAFSRRALQNAPDPEALEFFARLKGTLPFLRAQFRLMVMLAETIPENRGRFINDRNSRPAAFWFLFRAGLRSIVKLIRGWLIYRRVRHG